jgi:hypothetical protein
MELRFQGQIKRPDTGASVLLLIEKAPVGSTYAPVNVLVRFKPLDFNSSR